MNNATELEFGVAEGINAQDLEDNIKSLQEAVLANHPDLGMYMARIHKAIVGRPELLHVLSREQIRAIVEGQSQVKNVCLATLGAKTKAKKPSAATEDIPLL